MTVTSCDANGWKDDDKIKKLPAFLRGPAATHFYAIPEEDRKTYNGAVKDLNGALCPPANRKITTANSNPDY